MIARKSALIIFIQILNGILGYIGLKFIALYIEPWEYGIIGFAYGFVAIFSIFGKLGFNQAHIKKISEGKNFSTCIATFAFIKTFLAGFLAIITFLSIAFWKIVLNQGFESQLHEQAIYLMLAYFVIFTLTQIMIFTFNSRKESAKAQIPLLFFNLIRIPATIIVAIFGFNVLVLAYTYVIGELFHFILAFLLFRKYSVGKPSFDVFKDYSKFAYPMAIVTSSILIMKNIDKVFIQLFWSSQQVGEYFAVNNLSRFIILFATSISLLLFPTISEYHAKNKFLEIKDLIFKSERYLSMIVFPIIILMVVLAEQIIRILLSNKYSSALPLLQILPFFVLLEILSRPYQSQLQGMNYPKIERNRVVLMVIFNITLNLILIPKDINSIGINLAGLGATGAAIATVISYIIGFVYIRLMSWKLTGIKGNPRIILHASSAILMGITLFIIIDFFFIERWYHLLLISIFGILIYLIILIVIKEFNKKDFMFFMDTLNIKKMLIYIKDEITKK